MLKILVCCQDRERFWADKLCDESRVCALCLIISGAPLWLFESSKYVYFFPFCLSADTVFSLPCNYRPLSFPFIYLLHIMTMQALGLEVWHGFNHFQDESAAGRWNGFGGLELLCHINAFCYEVTGRTSCRSFWEFERMFIYLTFFVIKYIYCRQHKIWCSTTFSFPLRCTSDDVL